MKARLLMVLVVFLLCTDKAQAYSEMHDEYTLELKGFSREIIEPVRMQIDRNEGRYPAKPNNKVQGLIYNLINNEYVQTTKPFGYNQAAPRLAPNRLHL